MILIHVSINISIEPYRVNGDKVNKNNEINGKLEILTKDPMKKNSTEIM